jgi:hypothetical protein
MLEFFINEAPFIEKKIKLKEGGLIGAGATTRFRTGD